MSEVKTKIEYLDKGTCEVCGRKALVVRKLGAKDLKDGPRCLFDMMDIDDERIKPFLNNYKLNIISAADMAEGDFEKFHINLFIMDCKPSDKGVIQFDGFIFEI